MSSAINRLNESSVSQTELPPRPRWSTARIDALGVAVVCVLHFLLVCDTSARQSITIDEFAHLPAGLTYLQTGTFRLYPYNPPLPRLPPALAASLLQPRVVYDRSWRADRPNHLTFAEEYLLANTSTPEATANYLQGFLWGRRTIALWSALTIPVLFSWGRWWFGRGCGWMAALLWALCPNIIAHAGLITTDLAAASLSLTASWFFARWLEVEFDSAHSARTKWQRLLVAGFWLGMAWQTKFSVLLLGPIWLLWLAGVVWNYRAELIGGTPGTALRLRVFARVAGRYAVLLLTGCLVLNAGYLFEGTGTPLGRFPLVSELLTRPRTAVDDLPPQIKDPLFSYLYRQRVNRFQDTWIGLLPVPVPRQYVLGFDILKFEAEGKYGQYLRGVWKRPESGSTSGAAAKQSASGWWYYYVYGLAVKWPLSTWLLLGMALCAAWLRPAGERSVVPWVLLAGGPLAALSLLQDVNLGLRYALPTFSFFFLIAGTAVSAPWSRWLRVVPWLAVAWNGCCVARIHPHELAYFNAAAGGAGEGRFHLIDSNLDWGQDLSRLALWVEQHPEWKEVQIAYWGPTSPELYGLQFGKLPPRDLRKVPVELGLWPGEVRNQPLTWGPQPGKYAVSVNFERGMSFRTPCPPAWQSQLSPRFRGRFGLTMLQVPWDCWSYFQEFTPIIEPRIGYSILLYDVTKAEANRVRSKLGLPELL